MLDNLGLIHMNGRVYDPVIGRFLSVDPVFQFPENTQSLNPYTYVLNTPLSLTDPTGYFSICGPTNRGFCSSVSFGGMSQGRADGASAGCGYFQVGCQSNGRIQNVSGQPDTIGSVASRTRASFETAKSDSKEDGEKTREKTPEERAREVLTEKPLDGELNMRNPDTATADGRFDPEGKKKLRSAGKRVHKGVDIRGAKGTPVKAAGKGTVTNKEEKDEDGNHKGWGKYIEIEHRGGVVTRYAHLNEFAKESGDTVEAGDPIGEVGRTGNVAGDTHLHYEVLVDKKVLDPQSVHTYEMQK